MSAACVEMPEMTVTTIEASRTTCTSGGRSPVPVCPHEFCRSIQAEVGLWGICFAEAAERFVEGLREVQARLRRHLGFPSFASSYINVTQHRGSVSVGSMGRRASGTCWLASKHFVTQERTMTPPIVRACQWPAVPGRGCRWRCGTSRRPRSPFRLARRPSSEPPPPPTRSRR